MDSRQKDEPIPLDAQSFPLTVPESPELAQKGVYSSQETYSSADVQDVGAVS